MENGEWRMENGEWRMKNGEWRTENREWRMEVGSCGLKYSLGENTRLQPPPTKKTKR